MNDTNVPSGQAAPVLDRLVGRLPELSPQLRKAAQYVIDHPSHVGVSSIREIADAAAVKPNTLVRMARAVGFDGFEDFRQPFRETLRAGGQRFPDRARWLQSIAKGGRHGGLYRDMAASALDNVERLFAGISAKELKAAADRIVAARKTFVVGVGVSYALAHNFAYLARMALDTVVAVPQEGSLPVDDVARAGRRDLVLAMTFEPYRSEVVDAVRVAGEQGARIIAITDSRASPIALKAAHVFVVPTETPQFFTSTIAAAALLETMMAFVVADADRKVIASIDRFHQRRQDLGVYWREGR
ncbi:MAG: MurR/RpiR family transcriptional regulator [Gammaproteobacteria bacterium]|nr:MurR/RpiR family transcriptional regulator [Gammaproteobacteria bacterium]